jgi:microcystin degradation protein MlrC
MPAYRIAVCGFIQEAMTRSPFLTDASTTQVARGEEIRAVTNYRTVLGAIDRLDAEADVEMVPLIFARSLSGGSLEPAFYESIKAETVALLREHGPFDGVALINHGAMEVDGYDVHGDTDFVLAVREAVGPDAAIGIPFDLHGQLSASMLDNLQAISVLRTAPHRDQYEAGHRVAGHVVDAVRKTTKPTRAYVHLPMAIPGEKSMTTHSPGRELWGALQEYDAVPGVIEASILLGFGWNDRPWVGTQAIVVTDDDPELAARLAEEIAATVWARRAEFGLHMETAEVAEGLLTAARARQHPVYVTDSGDNVSAGAGGDTTGVLQTVLGLPEVDDVVFAGIYAPLTVAECIAAGVGATVRIDLGSEHASVPITSFPVDAIVEAHGDFLEIAQPSSASSTPTRSDAPWVRLRIGNALVTMHAERLYISQPQHFTAMGIHPTDHQVYVVKLGYLLPQLEDIAARFILLLSDGAGAMDFDRLSWDRIARPVFPVDKDMEHTVAGTAYTAT